jgi:1-acyl-sn-glycerol-3-phosphate acyltransferase
VTETEGHTDDRRLIGGVLSEVRATQAFVERWIRRGVIASFGLGFAVPYFSLLNEVEAQGDDLLESLPHRNVVFLSNHQTYFLEAIAFFDLVYVRHQLDLEDPFLRFSAAEETMKKNVLTGLMKLAGGVTLRRSFRAGGRDVKRDVDLEGVARVEQAIRDGWLLHFPAGTTRKGAPLRPGVARILHDTKAVAVPVRINGFRELLVHKQLPGKLFKGGSIRIHDPLKLDAFYEAPFTGEAAAELLARLDALIGDRPDGGETGAPRP